MEYADGFVQAVNGDLDFPELFLKGDHDITTVGMVNSVPEGRHLRVATLRRGAILA